MEIGESIIIESIDRLINLKVILGLDDHILSVISSLWIVLHEYHLEIAWSNDFILIVIECFSYNFIITLRTKHQT